MSLRIIPYPSSCSWFSSRKEYKGTDKVKGQTTPLRPLLPRDGSGPLEADPPSEAPWDKFLGPVPADFLPRGNSRA